MPSPEIQRDALVLASSQDIIGVRKSLFDNIDDLLFKIDQLDSGKMELSEVKSLFTKLLNQLRLFKELNKQLDIIGEAIARNTFLCSQAKKIEFTNTELDELTLEINHLLSRPHSDFRSISKTKEKFKLRLMQLKKLLLKYELQQNDIIFDSWYMDIGECD